MQLGGGHPADAQSQSFGGVEAYHIVYRADIEIAVFAVLGGGDIARGEDFGGLFERLEGGHAAQLRSQAVDERLLGIQRQGAHLLPAAALVLPDVGGDELFAGEGHIERVGDAHAGLVAEPEGGLVGVDLPQLLAFEEGEGGGGVGDTGGPESAVGLHELLFHDELVHEVHVDAVGNVDDVAFHGVGAVVDDVHPSVEAVVVAVDGREGELDAGDAVYHHGVGDVVVVEGGADGGGERADEAVEHQLDVIVEDVDFGEDGVEVGAEALLVEALVGSLHPSGAHVNHVLARGFSVVVVLQALPHRDSEHGHRVGRQRVDVFLEEGPLPGYLVLLEVHIETSEREY